MSRLRKRADWLLLNKYLNDLIACQKKYNDGDHRYSFQIKKSLSLATFRAEQVISMMCDEAINQKSLQPLLLALEKERSRFDFEEEDDGYGCGCLGDIIANVSILQKELGEQCLPASVPEEERSGAEQPADILERIQNRTPDIARIGAEFGFSSIRFLGLVKHGDNGTEEGKINIIASFQACCSTTNSGDLQTCVNALQRLLQIPVRVTETLESSQN